MLEIITESQPRIKFQKTFAGHSHYQPPADIAMAAEVDAEIEKNAFHHQLEQLGQLQGILEQQGVIPILDDGLVGGNCAMVAPDGCIFVSKSGKQPGRQLQQNDFVLVKSFDRQTWTATYASINEETTPSSDSPLHWAALTSASVYNWPSAPKVAIHGHALAEGVGLERAVSAGLPISEHATLFSTPEDLEALEQIFTKHPYPEHCCFIRRGHGFFLLASSVEEAHQKFKNTVLPLLQ